MSGAGGYRDLDVWAKALDLAEAVYRASSTWPADERFGLTSQTRRAAVSIAANIAEGAGRRTKGEFLQFLGIAKGSLAEMETLLLLSARLSYLSDEGVGGLLSSSDHISRMITALARALQERPK